MTINFTKSEALEILEGKRNLITTYRFPDDLTDDPRDLSDFNLLVRDYFNTLCAYLETPLLKSLGRQKKLRTENPAMYWIEQFIKIMTTSSQNKLKFTGTKEFEFIRRGRERILVHGFQNLKDYSQETKLRVSQLQNLFCQFVKLNAIEDLNLVISKKTPQALIRVNLEKCELHYKNSPIQSLTPKKLPHDIFRLAFDENRNRHEFKLSELNKIGYSNDDVKEGIDNFNKFLKRKLKRIDTQLPNDFSKEPLISSPSSTIKISRVFFKN